LLDEEEPEEILTNDDLQNAISHCELEGVTPDLIDSMLLRSWICMRAANERAEDGFFKSRTRIGTKHMPGFRCIWSYIPARFSNSD